MSRTRRAIERLYVGRCDIVEWKGVPDPITKITKNYEVTVREGLPCRLSHERLSATGEAAPAAIVTQGVKVLMAPEIQVKPGSKLVITQNGVTGEYVQSGQPAVYASHQEILLELFRGWA